MTRKRLTLILLGVAVLAVILAGCGGNDRKSEQNPTLGAATITPPPTRTPSGANALETPTTLPTWTAIAALPTSTPLVVPPPAIPSPLPTWTPAASTATPYPYDVRIAYPVSGSQIAGYVTIVGSASHPRFVQYALEWGPDPNPSNLWYPFLTPPQRTNTVLNSGLGAWNTTLMPDGVYQIRVHAWLNDGTDVDYRVTGIRISNTTPTAMPTLTPTARPNQLPTINPIPSQQLTTGQTVAVPVTANDADGDMVNLFVSSSSPAVAAAQVTGTREITLSGLTAGQATVIVTANDNRGGTASTAFVVTVQGQNRAPTISPIPNQTITVGDIVALAVTTSDPDGDVLTLTATSDNLAVVNTSVPDASTVRIGGNSAGTANVTVTVSDGKGGAVNVIFQVTVQPQNAPPVINDLAPQSLEVGGTLDVPYTATDPNSDTLTAVAQSDNEAIVAVTIPQPGTIRLTGIGAGQATVTLSVSDGTNPATTMPFVVTVAQGNIAPAIEQVGAQSLTAGDSLNVAIPVTDPNGDPVTLDAQSDTPGVAVAAASGTDVVVEGLAAGQANITVDAADGQGGEASMTFQVSVGAANTPPVVDPIAAQTLAVSGVLDVAYNAVDADGDTLSASASSDNETVAVANVTTPGLVTLVAQNPGTATVTLNVTDGVNAAVPVLFTVTVTEQNAPPVIQPIDPQAISVGQSVTVPVTATDPNGDPVTLDVVSSDPAIAAVVLNGASVDVNGAAPGMASITVSASDDKSAVASVSFQVEVQALNSGPIVDAVQPQTVGVGALLDVPYNASDPDGDPLTAEAVSDNPAVVTASVLQAGAVHLEAQGPGQATVTLTLSDGVNSPVTTTFTVTVPQQNAAPVLEPIGDQTVVEGQLLNVPVPVTDPEGDVVTLSAVSDNPSIVLASADGGQIALTGIAPGTATITVDATDAQGAMASVSFVATVTGSNAAPEIAPVGAQQIQVGEQITVPLGLSDANGDPIVLTALPQAQGIVQSTAIDNNSVLLEGVAPGTTVIDLTADDGRGGVTTGSFEVTVVEGAPAPSGLMNYPIVPEMSQQVASNIGLIYQGGLGIGIQPGVFGKIGDGLLATPNFLAPYAADGADLGGYADTLGPTITFFRATSIDPNNPGVNSFNGDSVAVGATYSPDQLAQTAPAVPPCDAVGAATILDCEMLYKQPSIAFISFSASNVTFMDPAQFRSEIQNIVFQVMSTYGSIPVLATIPADASATTEQLADYNAAIVEVATQSQIPLWNVWRAMQERGIADPTSVSPLGAGDLTDASLSYGVNVRNLTALQTLAAVQQAAGIQ
ncbi:SGNH/GDSL hydrolase family protein [Aggregatilinea lenta]|uniref:SGNH/GDSL hydrolase family protein n=1 Tax=Aggregatilinea lenta TaxID=913108 RepID=UPI000E5AB616|nr:SGNH/GDSL hydrolase family protein [Aggregatilinea lenta]